MRRKTTGVKSKEDYSFKAVVTHLVIVNCFDSQLEMFPGPHLCAVRYPKAILEDWTITLKSIVPLVRPKFF